MEQGKGTRLVIWDWNGTLLDDTELCYRIANDMRVERGMAPLPDVEAYRRVFRFPIIDYYRAMGYTFETESYESISVEFHRLYEARSQDCPLYPEAKDALLAVRRRGVEQLLLSVSKQERLERQGARGRRGRLLFTHPRPARRPRARARRRWRGRSSPAAASRRSRRCSWAIPTTMRRSPPPSAAAACC